MKISLILIKRNIKLFFKDKGMFLTSLITPIILLVLYATFLANVYRDSFTSTLPVGVVLPEKAIEGLVAGQLLSSILAVSCVTVAFCSNFLMVQDRANGAIKDLRMSPVSAGVLSVSYYVATLVSTLTVCLVATAVCLVYTAIVGWYLSLADVIMLVIDVFVIVLFGTAVSSVINFFLSTQGQISAVGSIVSSGYGFICGAYMPISTFSVGLQKVISFLPGTYATSLVRTHSLRGVLSYMEDEGVPSVATDGIKKALDCELYFFDVKVSMGAMYGVLIGSIALFLGIYILLNKFKKTDSK